MAILLFILIFLPLSLVAQDVPYAILAYIEDPQEDMTISDVMGNVLSTFEIGNILPPGVVINTGSGIAEIQLQPNGTILRLAEGTNFSIKNLQDYKGSPANEFSLLTGKIRTIAVRDSGINAYNLFTPTATIVVKGTDFLTEAGADKASVTVRQGLVEIFPFSGPSTIASENQTVNTLAEVFQAVYLPKSQINALFQSMAFKKLSPKEKPGHNPLEIRESAAGGTAAPEGTVPESALRGTATPEGAVPEAALPGSVFKEEEGAEGIAMQALTSAERKKDSPGNREVTTPESMPKDSLLNEILRNIFNMEIGSTTMNGKAFAKVIIQPEIKSGRFKMGLYLPIFYVDKPQDDNEWSFGTDQGGDALDIFKDILKDTMLKIYYVEFGDPNWDKFYLKVGNLNNMSIGHGAIMNNYANDSEFPNIRKIGLNTGFNLGSFTMELVSDNLVEPSILGLRLGLSPFAYRPLQIGLTGITDLFPGRATANSFEYGDPWLLAFGSAIQIFEINNAIWNMNLFTDFSTIMTIFREETNHDTIKLDAGPATAIAFKNFGFIAGLRGKILKFHWAFQYRLSTGIYKPTLFNALYNRDKIQYLSEMIHYLNDSSTMGTTMGIYGEGGFSIKDKLILSLGYFWPWEINNSSLKFSNDDNLKISLVLLDGLIPQFPIHGSISYERTQFVQTLKGDSDLTLFDANTVVSGEITYSLTPVLDIVFSASTMVRTDTKPGKLIMQADGETPEITSVIGIETRIHF